MNIYELEKQATPGPLVPITNPSFDGTGERTVSHAHLRSEHRSAAPLAVLALADISVKEAKANAILTAHCKNNFMLALEALKSELANLCDASSDEDQEHIDKLDRLIQELEEVK